MMRSTAARKLEADAKAPPRSRHVRMVDPQDQHWAPDAGPARKLQSQLAGMIVEEPKWSPRRALGFILLTCSAFWIALGLLLRAVM